MLVIGILTIPPDKKKTAATTKKASSIEKPYFDPCLMVKYNMLENRETPMKLSISLKQLAITF